MKLTTQTKALKKALSQLAFLPGGNSADIVSSNLYIEAGFEGTVLKRRSTSATLEVNLESEIEEDGEAVIGFERFKNFIGNTNKESVELTLAVGGFLHVNAGSKVKIALITDSAYPPAPQIKGSKFIEQASNIAEWLASISTAYGTKDQGRTQLEGMVLETVNGRLWFCAADGRRAHGIITQHEIEVECNVPRDSSDAIKHLAKGEDEATDLIFRIGENSLGVDSTNFRLTCQLGSENTIKVSQILLKEGKPLATISRKDAYDAAVEASAFVSSKLDPLEFVFGKKSLRVIKSDSTGSSFEKTLDAHGPDKDVSLAFNWDYFTDALAACKNPDVQVLDVSVREGETLAIMIAEHDRKVMVMRIRTEPTK